MDVTIATGLFLDRLVDTTRTDQPWREIQLVQGSEYDGRPGYPYASNYQAQWAAAGALIDLLDSTGGTPPTGTLMDWITRMTTPADQAELAAFKTDIIAGVVTALTQGSSSELFLNRMYYSGQADNRGQDTANKAATADAQSPVTSRQDHKDYPKNMFLSGMDEKTSANGAAIAELAQTLVSLATRLDAIAATLAAQDAAEAAK
jgi:hypothetical protein